MRWIARFFLMIALVFLALDITDSGDKATPTTGEPAVNGPATGGAAADGTATDGAATGGTATDGAATGGTAATSPPPPPTVSGVLLRPLGERWFDIHAESYQQVSPAVSRHVSPWLDDNIVQPLMLYPGFLIFFFLSLVFGFFSWLIARATRDDDW